MTVNPAIYCFVQILNGNVVCNGSPVPVRDDFAPGRKRPIVTMVLSDGGGDQDEKVFSKLDPLPENHPYYDPAHPDDNYVQARQEVITQKKRISLHGWADNKEDQDILYSELKRCIRGAKDLLYPFCVKYSSGYCKTTNKGCDAANSSLPFGVSGQCPYAGIKDPSDPNYRAPSSFFVDANITPDFVKVVGEQHLMDLDVTPVEYRVVIDVEFEINEVYERAVSPLCKVNINSEEVR